MLVPQEVVDHDEVALFPAVVLALVGRGAEEAVAAAFDHVEPGLPGMAVQRLRLARSELDHHLGEARGLVAMARSLRNLVRVPRGVASMILLRRTACGCGPSGASSPRGPAIQKECRRDDPMRGACAASPRRRRSAARAASTRRTTSRICSHAARTRTKFLNDRAIGNEASGLTQVMIQFAPGKTQSLHRHPGEAWLYVVEGRGHSFLGTAPDKGEHHRWKKGDLIVVDHFLWHQHFNDDPKSECRLCASTCSTRSSRRCAP